MVQTTLAKLSGHDYSIKGFKLPGLSIATLKKYPALLPIHFFTLAGLSFGTWYIFRLLYVPDTIINKYETPSYMAKPTKISLIQLEADYKKVDFPKQMPNMYEK